MTTQKPQRTVLAAPSPGGVRPMLPPETGVDQSIRTNAARTAGLVIVGIDGSGCARDAAQWAAAEAVRRHAVLGLVYAYHLPPTGSFGYSPSPASLLADLRETGWGVLADTAAVLRRTNPGLQVTMKLIYGHPAAVLRKASKRAQLTVVGSHGRNRVRVTLGSVAAEVTERFPGPVAVIDSAPRPSNGPVAVGADGGATNLPPTPAN